MKGLLVAIVLCIIIYSLFIFSINYLVISNIEKNNILIFTLLLSSISFLFGVIIAIYSSNKNCKRVDKWNLIRQGFRHVFYSLIGYLIVYYIRIIREPFLDIFGDKTLGYSIAQSFIIIMNSITATIINYYQSIEASCKIPQENIDKNLKKLDKYLNEKPKKMQEKKIIIRD